MRRLRRYIYQYLHYLLPLPILLGAVLVWVKEPGFLVQLRLYVFDEYLRLKPREYEPAPVRVVDIDDDSLERFGQWPWPRTLLSELVNRLNDLGAAAMAFDILFIDPDRTNPSRLIESLPEISSDNAVVNGLKALPDHDRLFADAIAHAPVVIGFAPREKEHSRLPQAKASFALAGDDPIPWVPQFAGARSSLPALEAAAAGNGSLGVQQERDGIVRRVPLVIAVAGRLYPSLDLEALRVAQGARSYVIKSTGASGVTAFGEHAGLNAIKVGKVAVPTGADGTVWIHLTAHQPERFVSAREILDGSVDPDLIRGNIVVIGTTAEGLRNIAPLHSIQRRPASRSMPSCWNRCCSATMSSVPIGRGVLSSLSCSGWALPCFFSCPKSAHDGHSFSAEPRWRRWSPARGMPTLLTIG